MFFLFLFQILYASSCTTVDINSETLGPPIDQGISSWCYAVVASDLLTAKVNQRVSPTDIALNYYSSLNKFEEFNVELASFDFNAIENKQAGLVDLAIKKIEPQGYCLMKDLPLTKDSYEEFLALDDTYIINESSNRLEFFDKINKFCFSDNNSKCLRSQLLPKENFCDLFEIGKKLNKKRMNEIRELACRKRIHHNKKIIIKTKYTKPDLKHERPRPLIRPMDDLNKQLSNNKIVAAYLDWSFVKDSYDPHAVSIVGRKEVNGKCHYLIRESHGATCLKAKNNQVKCEKSNPGNYWVPDHVLEKKLTGIIWLD